MYLPIFNVIHFAPKAGDSFEYVATLQGKSRIAYQPNVFEEDAPFENVLEMTTLKVVFPGTGNTQLKFDVSSFAHLHLRNGKLRLKFERDHMRLLSIQQGLIDPFFFRRFISLKGRKPSEPAWAFVKMIEPFGYLPIHLPREGGEIELEARKNQKWHFIGERLFRGVTCFHTRLTTLTSIESINERWTEDFFINAQDGSVEQYRFPIGSQERPERLGQNLVFTVTKSRR